MVAIGKHDQLLQAPWPSIQRQRQGVNLGMWIFLASETLFFGGLFLSYTVYRNLYAGAFRIALHETNLFYGTINTALLLTSSLVITLAVVASEQARSKTLSALLLLAFCLGLTFLSVKGLEYHEDIAKRLVPGSSFGLEPAETRLFFALYWLMTGVHALHLAVGVMITGFIGVAVLMNRMPAQSAAVEATSLYWHFVDSIWVVVYALLYLPGRP